MIVVIQALAYLTREREREREYNVHGVREHTEETRIADTHGSGNIGHRGIPSIGYTPIVPCARTRGSLGAVYQCLTAWSVPDQRRGDDAWRRDPAPPSFYHS